MRTLDRAVGHMGMHAHRRSLPLSARQPRAAALTQAAPARGPGQLSSAVDVVALGNLCVDVFVDVTELPPSDTAIRRKLLDELTQTCTDKSAWEVGGNTNFMIAAARLGLNVASVGHTGQCAYGQFLDSVLQEEGVHIRECVADMEQLSGTSLRNTLVCFVLVDPQGKHAFCSRYDFGPWPLLEGVTSLPASAVKAIRGSRAVFTNGFVFDEMPLPLVQAACQDAIQHGSSIFFDPGPRCHTMLEGSRRQALDCLLDLSNCVLMTEEEAHVTTGYNDPEKAAWCILNRANTRARWCVVKMGGEGALLASKASSSTHRAKAIKVDVLDTVGCGDSFAAAIVMGYINKFSVPTTMALATAVGAATASSRGAGRNVAHTSRVLELLAGAAREGSGEEHETYRHAMTLLERTLASRQVAAAL